MAGGSEGGAAAPLPALFPPSSRPRGRLKGKCSLKTLPKIKEKLEVTQASHSSNQSTLLNVQEETHVEETEEQIGESAVLLKESSVINFESKESLKNAEVTSSTGLTLPTGVSTFLIECLDVDSTADYNTGSNDSVNICSSPEIFRDEDGSDRSNLCLEDFVKYKNSTLLDCSKAMTIDKMPQISNLSAILEPMQEDFRDQYTRRNKPSKCNYSSSELNISTTLAGKKVCKITAARERTPDLKTDLHCSSLPDNQATKAKKLKCKRKAEFSRSLEEDVSSFRQLESAPENTSTRSVELTTQVLPSKKTDAVVQMSSSMLIMENNKALPKISDCAQPAELDPLYNRREICSIVRTSPGHRSSRLPQIPLNRSAFCFPKRLPEEIVSIF
ncbi:meiosis-specific kinetochore protein [Eudromia elegans]